MDQQIAQIFNSIREIFVRLSSIETRRINQQQILPLAVKQRHIDGFIIFKGLDANLPSNGSTEVQFYLATDTLKFYAWNGTAWKSTTLS